MAAGSMTITETTVGTVKKIKAAWTTGSAGEGISGTTTKVYSGRFIGLIAVPGGTTPSDNYTITVKDADAVDLCLGAATGNQKAASTTFTAEASMAGVAMSTLTLAISSAGNSKTGTTYLLIR